MNRDGFGSLVRSEWTKLRTVRSTAFCVVAAIGLTVLLSVFGAAGSRTNANVGPPYVDSFHFVHQPLTGDGTVVARVTTQEHSHDLAKAGVIIKQSTTSGSPYAALMVTPRHGVRFQANFRLDRAGSATTAPRWLRLDRSGNRITGYESADGAAWSQVGTVDLALPQTVEVGLFVASPPKVTIRHPTSSVTEEGMTPTVGTATFDNVRLLTASGRQGAAEPWRSADVGALTGPVTGGSSPDGPASGRPAESPEPGGSTESAGVFTVRGSGNIAPAQRGDDDIVRNSLLGVLIGLMAIVALGVLFATSEYRRGMIRTTFAASPRRGWVLAAKAVVLGGAAFVTGLVASFGAYFLAQPVLRGNGYAPPAYPHPSLLDEPVLRAVVGTAGFLALIALFSLGVGAILRRTASAITLVIGLVVVPQLVAAFLSVDTARWIHRLTPAAGMQIQQTVPRYDNWTGPWSGLAILCVYAAVALGLALWLLRRRDA